jgi:hypothetical protein
VALFNCKNAGKHSRHMTTLICGDVKGSTGRSLYVPLHMGVDMNLTCNIEGRATF